MPKKKPTKAVVQTTEADAEALQRQIAILLAEIEAVDSEADLKIAELKAARDVSVGPKIERVIEAAKRIHEFAESNRGYFTDDGKKNRAMIGESGSVQWSVGPPKVDVKNKETALAALKRLRLKKFIRIVEEVDKDAILKDPDKIKNVTGLSITRTHKFSVRPENIDARVDFTMSNKRWHIVRPKQETEE